MKKCFLLLIVVVSTLVSCSVDDDSPSFSFEVIPVENVNMPEEFVFGETYKITMDYIRPTDCHVFNSFFYQIDGQERTVGIINTYYANTFCQVLDEEVSVSFDFIVTSYDTYVFKFFQGEDEDGVDKYLIMEVPVVE